jgi:plastocyanin
MELNRSFVLGVGIACATAVWGCGSSTPQGTPVSPSLLNSPSSTDTPRSRLSAATRRVDNDGDGYDDGPPSETPPADPGTGTPPASDTPPPVDMPTDPQQVTLTVNIVGTFGTGAFNPNPTHAIIGNKIVWMNGDLIQHDIVLDDGTPVGYLVPGQSSMPVSLAAEAIGYHCTLHPSMTGQITTAAPPAPTDGTDSATDAPAPGPEPDPSGDDGDEGDDGYDPYDYLKAAR